MSIKSCMYLVNRSDRIAYVSPNWSAFAQDNGAPELSEPGVIGRDIWDFITGEETRRIYREIFRQIREEEQELILPFRCDSPTLIRHMEMTLRPALGGAIEFETRLIRSEDREEIPLFSDNVERSNEHVPICSFCRRLQLEEEWLPAGDAVTRQCWFGDRSAPKLSETLCTDCLRELQQDLGVG